MMKFVRIGLVFGFLFFGLVPNSHAQVNTHTVKPSKAYDGIDFERQNKVLLSLDKGSEQEKTKAINAILKNPNNYNPTVIYVLSNVLFEKDRKDEAMYWFYIAQLRARYDANLCLDASAKQIVLILNEKYGLVINQYAFKDLNKLKITVKKVVDFVRSNKEEYDHRWISLHGMGAFMSGNYANEQQSVIQPADKWPEIKRTTVDYYYTSFLNALKTMK